MIITVVMLCALRPVFPDLQLVAHLNKVARRKRMSRILELTALQVWKSTIGLRSALCRLVQFQAMAQTQEGTSRQIVLEEFMRGRPANLPKLRRRFLIPKLKRESAHLRCNLEYQTA